MSGGRRADRRAVCHRGPVALLPDHLTAGPLELVRWSPDRADDLRAAVVASFAELHRWMPWAAEPPAPADTRAVVDEGARAFDDDVEWSYLLTVAGDGDVVGCAAVHTRGPAGTVEIGYWVRTDVTGRGYATEAARALTTAAFTRLHDVDRVEIWADVANTRSTAVAARLGYRADREIGHTVDAPAHSGRFLVLVMERADWPVGRDAGPSGPDLGVPPRYGTVPPLGLGDQLGQ